MNKMDIYYDLVREPIITEQSFRLIESHNRYTFKVGVRANKVEIKKAVEAIFDVKVIKVNTINVKPKFKRVGQHEGYTAAYKKAIVQLQDGQTIEAFNI